MTHLLELEPDGVRRSIDAVGFEARNVHLDIEQDIILQQMVAVYGLQWRNWSRWCAFITA